MTEEASLKIQGVEVYDDGLRFEGQWYYKHPVNPDNTTLRDEFAKAALMGIIMRGFTEFGNSQSAYAAQAYQMADAMLAEREKK